MGESKGHGHEPIYRRRGEHAAFEKEINTRPVNEEIDTHYAKLQWVSSKGREVLYATAAADDQKAMIDMMMMASNSNNIVLLSVVR